MVIVWFVDLGGIDDHCCLEVIACFVDLGGIEYRCCLEVIVCLLILVELITIAV